MKPTNATADSTPACTNAQEPGPALAALATQFHRGIAFAGLALLAFVAHRFRLEFSTRAAASYLLGFTLVIGGMTGARLKPVHRVATAVLASMVGLVLLGGEATLEWITRYSFVREQRAVASQIGIPFDDRTIPQVVSDLRANGTPAVPSVVPKVMLGYTVSTSSPQSAFNARFFPLGGISRRPTVQLCIEDGRYPVYLSDAHGFNNPADAWDSLPAQLLFIGDSYTHGYCVQQDSSLPDRFRGRWPRTVNLGSGGSGPLSELATLQEFGLSRRAPRVFWMYSENDLPDLANERAHPVLSRYADTAFTQHLIDRQAEVDSALGPWVDRLYSRGMAPRGHGEHGLRQLITLAAIRQAIWPERSAGELTDPLSQVPLFRQILTSAADRVTAAGGRMFFVFLPAWERYYKPQAVAGDRTRTEVLATARQLGLQVIDLGPVFGGALDRDRLWGRRGVANGHYSGAGYDLAAKAIIAFIDSVDATRKTPADGRRRP